MAECTKMGELWKYIAAYSKFGSFILYPRNILPTEPHKLTCAVSNFTNTTHCGNNNM